MGPEEAAKRVKDWVDSDPVEAPLHYTQHKVECIEITETMSFCRGNAVKYLWRAGNKGDELEDLRKARWYLNREIDRLERSNAKYSVSRSSSGGSGLVNNK